MALTTISDDDFQRLTQFIHKEYSITLAQKRQLVTSRLSSFVSQKGYTSYTPFVSALLKDRNPADMEAVLNRLCQMEVREARHGDEVRRGLALLAPAWTIRLGTPPSTWARRVPSMAWVAMKSMSRPARKFRPSPSDASLGTHSWQALFPKRMTVSNMVRSPSWRYWPMEWRSAVNSTLAGKRPLPSLPSLSP